MRTSRVAVHHVLILCVLAAEGWADCRKPLAPGVKLQLPDPTLISFSLAPESIVGGASSQATVTLSGSVVGCNRVIKVSNDRPAVVTAPATVTIEPGQSKATFPIQTRGVAATTGAVLKASDAQVTLNGTLTIQPAALSALSSSFGTQVYGGRTFMLEVHLNGNAPPGGAPVMLSSAPPDLIKIPGFIKVPENASAVSFPAEIPAVSNASDAGVTGTYAGVSRSLSFKVVPPRVDIVRFDPASVLGGSPSTGDVVLSGPAPSTGCKLTIQTNNSPVVPFPPEMIVPAGAKQANFNVTTNPVAAVVTVYVSVSTSGVAIAGSLAVLPPTLQEFGVNPSSASYQIGSVDGFITLNGPAAAGTSVPLSWNSTDAASAPSSVPIPAGASTASFKVTLKPVSAPTPFTLSVLYGGVRKTITLTVTP